MARSRRILSKRDFVTFKTNRKNLIRIKGEFSTRGLGLEKVFQSCLDQSVKSYLHRDP